MFIQRGKVTDPVKKIQTVRKQISAVQRSISMKAMEFMGSKKLSDTKMVADCQKAVKDLKKKSSELEKLQGKGDITMDAVSDSVDSALATLRDMKQKFGV